jgi:hypothetical protein
VTSIIQPLPNLERFRNRSLAAGCVALLICLAGAVFLRGPFLESYLVAYLFWLGLALGCLAIVMMYHLTGGRWGAVIRRILESGMHTLPCMALLFLPLLVGIRQLYPWTMPGAVNDSTLQHQRAYLNIPFFVVRALFYFAVWNVLAYFLERWSEEQDRTGSPELMRRFQLLSGPGLLAYGITMTFASIDWAMSLDAHWYSTIYGMIFLVAQALSAFAFVIPVLALFVRRKLLVGIVSANHFHDLGNLMLTFVMLWAYFSFSQFLIIWAGDLSDEIPWYLRRTQQGWQWIAIGLAAVHFFLPFLMLLSRRIKRSMTILSWIAIGVLTMTFVDLYWLIAPALSGIGVRFHWSMIVAAAGIGGIWLAIFADGLHRHAPIPLQDPNLSPYPEVYQ